MAPSMIVHLVIFNYTNIFHIHLMSLLTSSIHCLKVKVLENPRLFFTKYYLINCCLGALFFGIDSTVIYLRSDNSSKMPPVALG
jgi:hypothetical protein